MISHQITILQGQVMTNGTNANGLHVFIGHHKKIATISIPIGSETDISLTYMPSWVEEGFAISAHLPLNGNFDHRAVRNYLQNLLPEGKGKEITSHTNISKNNTFGLIRIIGEETSGALSFRGENSRVKETTLREITQDEIKISAASDRVLRANDIIALR